ncbi:MAG: hypothetical protein AAF682_32275 [Planctomycetota bacterium]
MGTQDRFLLLRRALLGNAAFSTACGLLLALGGGALAPVFGAPALALRAVGLVLLPFAYGLWQNARRAEVHRAEAWTAVVLDAGWVAGSAALVALELWPLTFAGTWAVVAVADVVLLFAVLQALGLRRSATRPAEAH